MQANAELRTSLINGQWGLMEINKVPLILMGINNILELFINPHLIPINPHLET